MTDLPQQKQTQSLTSHVQAQLPHCLQPPGLSHSPVPAHTPPSSHPLPPQPPRLSRQQAEYPSRQHHPRTDNITSQPPRWHCADPARRKGTVPLQGTPWLVTERKRRDASRNRASRTGFLCTHRAIRPHPTPSSPAEPSLSQPHMVAAPALQPGPEVTSTCRRELVCGYHCCSLAELKVQRTHCKQ